MSTFYGLVVPFLWTWGLTTGILLVLTTTDTADAETMFSRRSK